MKRKKSDQYTIRQTVGLTPEQMRRLRELQSVRARKDDRLIHVADLIREAINTYLAAQEDLPGSRRAIARGVEMKFGRGTRAAVHRSSQRPRADVFAGHQSEPATNRDGAGRAA